MPTSDFMQDWARREKDQRDANQRNRFTIMAALRQASVPPFQVYYDGAGDSGQIEGVPECVTNDVIVGIYDPKTHTWPRPEPEVIHMGLRKAVLAFCYDLLEDQHPGWEINEGSSGTFDFNPAEDKITLLHGQRIQEINETASDL